ncbi:MAG TPA: hypothetical protein VF660_02275, partial [Actinomycetota bacterium]
MTTEVTSKASDAGLLAVLNGNLSGKTRLGQPLLYNVVEDLKPVCVTDSLDVVGKSLSACVKRPDQLAEWFVVFDLRKPMSVGRVSLAAVAQDAGRRIDSIGDRAMVVVVAPSPSPAMDRVGDKVTPLLIAWRPSRSRTPHALASRTTRQTGLVANVDVAPTVLRFLRLRIPAEMTGEPLTVADAGPPFALHRVHLEQRRIRLPIQLGEIAFVTFLAIVGFGALIALGRRGSVPKPLNKSVQFLALCGLGFAVVVLAGGLLPRLTYPVVV